MSTKNPRFNITFDAVEAKFLSQLALQENKSVSRLAKELILEALERREDVVLSAIADARDADSDEIVSHEDAWK